MGVWRHYLLLFGGFYEVSLLIHPPTHPPTSSFSYSSTHPPTHPPTLLSQAFRETKWYNDLYLFNLQDLTWKKVSYPPTAPTPAPRSGCQMAVGAEVVFIHGGYSKIKPSVTTKGGTHQSNKAEGYVHDDTWCLQLKNIPSGGQPYWERVGGWVGGLVDTVAHSNRLDLLYLPITHLPTHPPTHPLQVSRKGSPPSPRSGASMVSYKTIALSFGGVHVRNPLPHPPTHPPTHPTRRSPAPHSNRLLLHPPTYSSAFEPPSSPLSS